MNLISDVVIADFPNIIGAAANFDHMHCPQPVVDWTTAAAAKLFVSQNVKGRPSVKILPSAPNAQLIHARKFLLLSTCPQNHCVIDPILPNLAENAS